MLTEDGDDRDELGQQEQRQRKEAKQWFLFRAYKQRQDAENRRQAELFQAKRASEWARAFPDGLRRLVQLPVSERLITRRAAAELRAWYDRTP